MLSSVVLVALGAFQRRSEELLPASGGKKCSREMKLGRKLVAEQGAVNQKSLLSSVSLKQYEHSGSNPALTSGRCTMLETLVEAAELGAVL